MGWWSRIRDDVVDAPAKLGHVVISGVEDVVEGVEDGIDFVEETMDDAIDSMFQATAELIHPYTTTVYSSSMLLMADTPDILKNSVTISILNNRSIADDLLTNLNHGIAVKANAARNYAKKHYTYGLPNGFTKQAPVMNPAVKLVIQQELDILIAIQFVVIDICSPDYYAKEFLQNNRDLNYLTQVVTPPFTVAEGVVVYYDYAQALGDNQCRIYYKYGTDSTAYEDITTVNMLVNTLYYHVGYYKVVSGKATGTLQYWFYQEDSEVHSTLTLPSGTMEDSPYYPIIPIRENNVDLTLDKTTDLYKTSKRCLRILGSDIDNLADGINANPNISDIDHAYVLMGIDIQTDVQNSIAYLHEYFTYLGKNSELTWEDYSYWMFNQVSGSAPPFNTVTIKDAKYEMDISYLYITTKQVTGSIGKIGFATRTNYILDNIGYETSYVIFQRQVTATSYEETLVKGLQHTNYIYHNHDVVTSLAASITDEANLNNFIIPLHYDVAKSLGVMAHTALIYDAYRIVFNSKTTQKIEWYQTELFKITMVLVAIAVTVSSLGSMATAMYTAYTAGGLAALSIAIVESVATQIALGYVLNEALEYAVDHYGIAAAIVATIVAYAVGNKLSLRMPTAIDLINSTSSVSDNYIEDKLYDLESEVALLQDEMDELELLEEDLNIDVSDLTKSIITGGSLYEANAIESPSVFYNRTIHYGNIGTLAFDVIENYVDDQLALEMPTSSINLII